MDGDIDQRERFIVVVADVDLVAVSLLGVL